MSDRLVELLRQRALMQEHLAWLEREIAEASPTSSAKRETLPAVPLSVQSPSSLRPAGVTTAHPTSNADAIIEQYRTSSGSLQSDVRKGCFLYFTAAFALLGLAVVALYFLISSR